MESVTQFASEHSFEIGAAVGVMFLLWTLHLLIERRGDAYQLGFERRGQIERTKERRRRVYRHHSSKSY